MVGALYRGFGIGVLSYGDGLVDFADHTLSVLGVRGPGLLGAAREGTIVTLRAIGNAAQNANELTEQLSKAYEEAAPVQKAELHGRVTDRTAVAAVVTYYTGKPIISVAVLAGNALDAGTTYQDEYKAMEALIFGDRK
jgi:hypothetical protein